MVTTADEEATQNATSTNEDGKTITEQEPHEQATAGDFETKKKVGRQWCMGHFSLFFNKLLSWNQNLFGTPTPTDLVTIIVQTDSHIFGTKLYFQRL